MSISSINFSRTSFTRNREAGAIIQGAGATPLLDMAARVFEADLAQGSPLVPAPSAWGAADLATITAVGMVPVVLPKPSKTWASYFNPPLPAPLSVEGAVTIAASPDFAAKALLGSISKAKKTLDIMIYQITDDLIPDQLVALAKSGVQVYKPCFVFVICLS